MIEGLITVQPFLWVQDQELVNEVQGIWVLDKVSQPFLHFTIVVLRKLQFAVQLQLVHPHPVLRGDGATQLTDEGDLLLL